jgi:hypothetical protein
MWWFVFRGSELLVRTEGPAAVMLRTEEWTGLGLPASEPLPRHGRPGAGQDAVWR